MKTNRAIIIGSGSSVRQNQWDTDPVDLSLWDAIKDEFTIGLNFSHKYYNSTILMYADYQFYASQKEKLDELPLVLGKTDGYYNRKGSVSLGDNVILLKEAETGQYIKWNEKEKGTHLKYWGKEAWSRGFYCSQLIGMKALNMAIALNCDEIYLLGFDATDINGHTHFYDDTNAGTYVWDTQKHNGVGKHDNGAYRTGNYNKIEELNKHWFKPFEQELKNIDIYNVSVNSKIDVFPKTTYAEFYDKIKQNPNKVNHEEIRQEIRQKLSNENR